MLNHISLVISFEGLNRYSKILWWTRVVPSHDFFFTWEEDLTDYLYSSSFFTPIILSSLFTHPVSVLSLPKHTRSLMHSIDTISKRARYIKSSVESVDETCHETFEKKKRIYRDFRPITVALLLRPFGLNDWSIVLLLVQVWSMLC